MLLKGALADDRKKNMNLVKRIIIKRYKDILESKLHSFYVNQLANRKQSSHRYSDFNYAMMIQYAENRNGMLNLLCDKYGIDKGESKRDGHPYPWPSHTYTDV